MKYLSLIVGLIALLAAVVALRRQFSMQDVFDEQYRRNLRFWVLEMGEDMSDLITEAGHDPVEMYEKCGLIHPSAAA